VKTTLAPGSKVVTDPLRACRAGAYLDKLGFSLVSDGCSTCTGNSGPLPPAINAAVNEKDLSVV
jgi:aconitate hydratase